MDSSADLGNLKTERWAQLQNMADRFEQAWQTVTDAGGSPDLAQFLPSVGDPLRSAALQEMIKTDLEIRWRRGQHTQLEFYLEKFPELGSRDSVSPQLIYEEYRARQLHGDRPDAETYQQRFPGRYQDLQRIIKDQPLPTLTTPVPTPSKSVKDMGVTTPHKTEGMSGAVAASQSPLSSTSDFLGGYKFIRKLGAGGFGEVWLAEAPGGVPAAIKKVFRSVDHEESIRERESLELIKTLRHPFLLSTTAFDQRDDKLFIVMELADGSLRDRLKECRKAGMSGIPLVELLQYFREAADALDYLHSKHVLHRDIKPDNILCVQQHTKLADFGLARAHQSDHSVMASGSGTPAYMPPEVWNGKVSNASDQYSLAMTYAELRLDRRLFQGKDMMQMMMEHLTVTPDLEPLPKAEQEVLLKGLAKDHNKRYPNCREFVRALETALAPILGGTHPNLSLPPQTAPRTMDLPSAGATEGNMEMLGTLAPGEKRPGGAAPPADLFATALHGSTPAPTAAGDKPGWKGTVAGKGAADKTALAPEAKKKPAKRSAAPLILGALTVVVFAAVGLIAAIVISNKGGDGSFTLEAPGPLSLRAGERKTLTIPIKRDNLKGPVKLSFKGLPKGVTIPDASIPDDKSEAAVEVSIDRELTPGAHELTLLASASSGQKEATFKLTIDTLKEVDVLPDRCVKADDAKIVLNEGKKYYDKIDFVLADGKQVRFLLVPKLRGADPETFYMMETKVWAGLFKGFATSKDGAPFVTSSEWEKGAAGIGKDFGIANERMPVFRVTVTSAYYFARWLGGNLPTIHQWDKACGYNEEGRGKGPFLEPWNMSDRTEIGVNRPDLGPLEVGKATKDVSPFGVRDMAGNGREWTRNLALDSRNRLVPLEKPQTDDKVWLRGHSYQNEDPLLYSELEKIRAGKIEATDYFAISPYTSFRVVIEP